MKAVLNFEEVLNAYVKGRKSPNSEKVESPPGIFALFTYLLLFNLSVPEQRRKYRRGKRDTKGDNLELSSQSSLKWLG